MKRYTESQKQNIHILLADRPHLTPIFTSSLMIPERVHDYSDELFLVYNNQTTRIELHSIDGGESTYNTVLPYKALDERTLRHIWRNDIRVHGKTIFQAIEKQEEKREIQKKKDEQKFIYDFGKEFKGEFAKDAWTM